MDKTLIILRNDVKKKRQQVNKKRQQLNFPIDHKLHLDVKELHVRELQKGNKFNLSEFYEMIVAWGVKACRNQ